ncbi:MAG: hypothetical protein ACOYOA_08050 [Saprospiraceae bacterium]
MRFVVVFAFGLSVLLSGCGNKISDDSSRVLAKVGERELRMSELEGMFPEGTTKNDSVTIISAFVSRWVKDNLVMEEAELNIPPDVNIDKLVREYRTSLVLNTYEQKLMSSTLDTTLSEKELRAFYDANKDLYTLQTSILRCLFVKLPNSAPNIKDFEKWWDGNKKADRNRIYGYASNYASTFLLVDSTWHKADRIALELPKGTIDPEELSTGEYTRKDERYSYFLKILGIKNKQDNAPFEFVKDQASKFILHQRKQKLIEAKREELYQRELAKNNVKIYY